MLKTLDLVLGERKTRLGRKKGKVNIRERGFCVFPHIKDSPSLLKLGLAKTNNMQKKLNKSRVFVITDAEGTDCTFADVFSGARTLKRFSCETGVTSETIKVSQAR
jgi:hypothetical protein